MRVYIKSFYLVLVVLILIPDISKAQESKKAVVEYIKDSYRVQLNIISLPDTFYDCGYDVYMYNYSNKDIKPKKDIGDVCLLPLMENNQTDIKFSDNGRKFYKAIKATIVVQCSELTNATPEQCKCAHDIYEKEGLGYSDLIKQDFEQSKIKQFVNKVCIAN